MNNKAILKVSAVILGWASIFHFANFLLGGVIVIMGYTVPVYFSLIASAILGFCSYKLQQMIRQQSDIQ